ncbi:uncharacterized protein LOC108100917 [Drosophila ficusphila]|uniref:uncharacterized protein LOC108100917 n=1 Tax=Drosophila ficusphila TaxID=30025 RepID=UPI0007E8B57B|nr:uncharacterized protein LOC108100917 [Drosophila ficusphila]
MSEPVPSTEAVGVKKGQSISKELWNDNAFLNYLRHFIKHCGDLSYMQLAQEAASSWEKMTGKEKDCYSNIEGTAIAITAVASETANNSNSGVKAVKCHTRPPKSCARAKKTFATPRRKAALGKPKRRAVCPSKDKEKEKKEKEGCATEDAKLKKTGPITINGYLNFLRSLRKNGGLKLRELVQQGPVAWRELSEEEKDRFRQMASEVTASACNVSSS